MERDSNRKNIDLPTKSEIYHEKQSRLLCAMHALNNFFQNDHPFSKSELDRICERLTPGSFINPHRNFLGLGNYDVNVLIAAFQSRNLETIWMDRRKSPNCLVLQEIEGFILNVPITWKIGAFSIPYIRQRHWVAVKKITGQYYLLDSKAAEPTFIGNEDSLRKCLQENLQRDDTNILLIVKQDVAEKSSWFKSPD
ncbi:DgyrCDS5071 [Dimorphilus gyrociliatus]|uniref:Josephin-2 n=1 Tax=Dimorphilus gyrociliatus TaxID=2664684 RepID=A0A7I8VJD0_9ANNE|nr:DgyrCDS5071 [Dimorphilus gyrociliatus]